MSRAYDQQLSVRPLDPNVMQRRASDPDYNIWVNASAGTGKTKVLTDRVLRLLLPRNDGRTGSAPHKILCITFTKAGASEMILRVQETLARWIAINEGASDEKGSLRWELYRLLGLEPTDEQVRCARSLFKEVVDLPGGLKIMTIHSFCQSVLARFPLEASITPNMRMLDELEARELLGEASVQVLSKAAEQVGSPLSEAAYAMGRAVHDTHFADLIASYIAEADVLMGLKKRYGSLEAMAQALCEDHGFSHMVAQDDLLVAFFEDSAFDRSALKRVMEALLQVKKAKRDQENGARLDQFLALGSTADRCAHWPMYRDIFLTQKGLLRKVFCTKEALKIDEAIGDILRQEAERVRALDDRLRAQCSIEMSVHALRIAYEVVEVYASLKRAKGCLDFDDQILKTLDLLRHRADWVMYKLDRGIDHILLDEAQDTNPEQWEIVKALYQEFFAQEAVKGETPRSVFVVGDEKQSIYGFQRASPEKFAQMRRALRSSVLDAGYLWDDVNLQVSFRSTPSVLRSVDLTFADETVRTGVSAEPVYHESFRRGQAGVVTLLPVCELERAEKLPLWEAYKDVQEGSSSSFVLAQDLALRIRGWLEEGRVLSSYDRPVCAGDIMILVRKRTRFVGELMRALRAQNIAVAGADRMRLSDQISVQDLLALCAFCLLPEDDLTLACLLKSPLIGLSEDDLFQLAHGRAHDLWSALKQSQHSNVVAYLSHLIELSNEMRPYEFLNDVLMRPCPAHERSGLSAFKARLGADVVDALVEFLNLAISFEDADVPTLQMFYEWARAQDVDIKREQDSGADMVRIMTVHGSKGLQAPIVILPDSVRGSKMGAPTMSGRVLWPAQTDLSMPLWCVRSDDEYDLYRDKKALLKKRTLEEDRRLLYVAMTRAEEALYVMGHHNGHGEIADESWHRYIERGLRASPDVEVEEALGGEALTLRNARSDPPDRLDKKGQQDAAIDDVPDCPDWLFKDATKEIVTDQYVTPSRMVEAFAPSVQRRTEANLSRQEAQARGHFMHKLLEVLPAQAAGVQAILIDYYSKAYSADLVVPLIEQAVQDVQRVLSHPDLQRFFTCRALVEVPVMARLETGAVMSGIIDRLCFLGDEVWVIDYKTGAHDGNAEVSQSYRAQMKSYQSAVQAMYPDLKICAALIWCDDCCVQVLHDDG